MALDLVQRYKAPDLAVSVDSGARTILPGTNVTFSIDPITGVITINASGATGGTVTSVAVANATGITWTGSPITTSGTLTPTLSANLQAWSGVTVASKANLASPVFTGNPTAPTPATADNDTSLATTAFVKAQGYSLDSGVVHIAGTETVTGAKTFSNAGGITVGGTGVQLTSGNYSKSGSFVSTDRNVLSATNTSTANTSALTLSFQAGSGGTATLSHFAPEYTVNAAFMGKSGIENPDAGILLSASGATGTHTWYTGVARTLKMTLATDGALTVVGNVTAPAFVGAAIVNSGVLTIAGTGIDFKPNGIFGSTLGSFDTSGNFAASGKVTSNGLVIDARGDVRTIPQVIKNATYTFAVNDGGNHFIKGNSTAYTWTIPPNSTVAFPIGTAITCVNLGGTTNNVTIALGAGVTLYRNGVSGSFPIPPGTMVTLLKVGTNVWQA